ncbi:MAG: sugar ABC transporter ATP-binding protein [Eubacteriales bacterium]|nr:sugar ABC transporter ATP-binding protein [Eubacteriales bacterium]
MDAKALEMQKICMSFNGVSVLKDVDFSLGQGEIRGLIGKNGAGKSTLLKIVQGIYTPTGGTVRIFGEEMKGKYEKASQYVGMIFQEFSLVSDLTVLENIYLNSEILKKGFIDDKEAERRVTEYFAQYDIHIDVHKKVRELNSSDMQMIEICKAVLKNKKIILMDEPTAALDEKQCEKLFAMVRQLKKNKISVVLITHHLKEIMQNCDSVTVIRDGILALNSDICHTTLEEIISAMLGEESAALKKKRSIVEVNKGTPVLEAKEITSRQIKEPLSFKIYPGEVVGLAGLKGCGRTEVFRALYGVEPITSGAIYINGKEVRIRHPKDAVGAGIFLVPESRQIQGLSIEHSLRFNLQLPWLEKMKKGIFLDERRGSEVVEDYIRRMQIKTSGKDAAIKNLSGGNQQKVVIAKAMATKPKIILMDDPTFGVDVHAKTEIMEIVDDFKKTGGAVLLASSEIEEVNQNCSRILILKNRRLVKELLNQDYETVTQDMLAAEIQ